MRDNQVWTVNIFPVGMQPYSGIVFGTMSRSLVFGNKFLPIFSHCWVINIKCPWVSKSYKWTLNFWVDLGQLNLFGSARMTACLPLWERWSLRESISNCLKPMLNTWWNLIALVALFRVSKNIRWCLDYFEKSM